MITMDKAGRQPLVLVPGLACDEALWAAQEAGLADIAAMQMADTRRDDSIGAMAQRLLDHAPHRFALAGLSMGGYVAMEVWRRAPDRVTRIALLDTGARDDDRDQRRLRKAAITTARDRGFEAVIRGSLSQLVHDDAAPELGEAVVAMALRVGFDTFVNQQAAIIGRVDSRPSLSTVTVPALVLVGDTDRMTPPYLAQEMAQAIPGATLRTVAQCGHMATMEQPAAVNAALREWLLR